MRKHITNAKLGRMRVRIDAATIVVSHLRCTRIPDIRLICEIYQGQDLGTDPIQVESKLMQWLRLGTVWEAILLLDGKRHL